MTDPEKRLLAVIAASIAVKLLLSEKISFMRAVTTVFAALFSAWIFTDPALAILELDVDQFRLPVAALLALTGENLMRAILDFSTGRGAVVRLIEAWRGVKR